MLSALPNSFISGNTGASAPRLFSNMFSHVNQLLEKAEGTFMSHPGANIKIELAKHLIRSLLLLIVLSER